VVGVVVVVGVGVVVALEVLAFGVLITGSSVFSSMT